MRRNMNRVITRAQNLMAYWSYFRLDWMAQRSLRVTIAKAEFYTIMMLLQCFSCCQTKSSRASFNYAW